MSWLSSRAAQLGAAAFFCFVAAVGGCSSSESTGTEASTFCGASRAAVASCASSTTDCDTTLTNQCGKLDAVLNRTLLESSRDCLESGICGASSCLTRGQSTMRALTAHTTLANDYCSSCAPGNTSCATQFYARRGNAPGAVVLPYSESVAAAVEEHYKPLGPSDRVPSDPISVAVALADKLDTLVGFWAIDEKPTGSKDPYALRRAALGVIRLVVENAVRLPIYKLPEYRVIAPDTDPSATLFKRDVKISDIDHIDFGAMIENVANDYFEEIQKEDLELALNFVQRRIEIDDFQQAVDESVRSRHRVERLETSLGLIKPHEDLLSFFHDRLKVMLRDQGARHDLVDAVLGEGASANDDLLLITRRVAALGRFLDTEDGRNLLAGYKRAANILKAEEKKDGEGAFAAAPELQLIAEAGLIEEKALAVALAQATPKAEAAVAAEDYEGAMAALAEIRPAVDAFFDRVTVNDPDPALRANRLKLLNQLRQATRAVADFDRIAG